jgi:hypothetical protein
MPLVTAKLKDWLKHPESSVGMVPHLEFSGGPSGGLENAIRFDLGATSSLQRVAYSNLKLGRLRGAGRFSTSVRVDESADRTKAATIVRWSPTRLSASDAGYAAELSYGVTKRTADGACSTGANTKITSALANFEETDVGRAISLAGAGAGGGRYVGYIFAVDSATQVDVVPTISTSVAGGDLSVSSFSYALRHGPDEAGEVLFTHRLNAAYGFVPLQWIEVGVDLTLDNVGNLKLLGLVRPNPQRGVSVTYPTFAIDEEPWYVVDRASILRHEALDSGEAGWQVLTRAGIGSMRVGCFRAKAGWSPLTELTASVVL